MDPNANLEEQLQLASSLIWMWENDKEKSEEYRQKAARLAELVIALDEWIKKGGFLPEGWKTIKGRG